MTTLPDYYDEGKYLASLSNAERLAWAKGARECAENWAIKSEMIAGLGTSDRAAQRLKYIDLIIFNEGGLPTKEQCQGEDFP